MTLIRHLPRFRRARRVLQEIGARETWTRDEIEAWQLERLNRVWQHARVHVPHYRELQAARRLPDRFASLAEFTQTVPVLTKQEVRSDKNRFLSSRAGRGQWAYTSGATGTPMPVYWGTAAHREMLIAKYRLYDSWGVGILDPMAFLWGHSASFAPGWRGRMARIKRPIMDWLRNRLRLSAYRLGRVDLRRHLQKIAAFRPSAIYGYSSAVWLLAQEAAATGFRCDSLKVAILTSEPSSKAMRTAVEEAFGVPAIQEYGSLDCGTIAGESHDRTLRIREDVSLVETVQRPDGHWDILVTVLNNPSFPLLRYAIGDVTGAPLRRPSQGFAILENVQGRSNELLVTRDGRHLHPFWLDDVLENTPGTRRWQVHQQRDGSISVAVELQEHVQHFDTDTLAERIAEHFDGLPVDVRIVDSIPQTIGGKHRWVISDAARLRSRRTRPNSCNVSGSE